QPPQPGGAALAGLVVGHDPAIRRDARRARRGLEAPGVRRRMAPALARWVGQIGVEVEERGAGDVTLQIGRVAEARLAELPAAVDHGQPGPAPRRAQPSDIHQWSEAHLAPSLREMRAMVLDKPRTPLRLADVPEPKPGPGQLLIEVDVCG